MKTGKLILLLVVAVALLVAANMAYKSKTTTAPKDEGGVQVGAALFPKLGDKADKIARVEYRKGDQKIMLTRDERNRWLVETSAHYPADPKRVTELVFNLTDMKAADNVTDRKEKYARFGLEGEVGKEGTIILSDKTGAALATLLRGDERKASDDTAGAGRPGGRYVRIPPDPRVYLVTEEYLRLGTQLADWIEPEVPVASSPAVVAVSVDHGTSESFALALDDSGALTLPDVPKGMQVKQYEITSTRDALDPLRIDDVLASGSAEVASLDFSTTCTMRVKSGIAYTARVAPGEGEKYYVALSAAPAESVFTQDDKATTVTMAKAQEEAAGAPEAVARFNEAHSRWVYQISSWTGKRLAANRSNLLEPLKEEPKPVVQPEAKAVEKPNAAKPATKNTVAPKDTAKKPAAASKAPAKGMPKKPDEKKTADK